MGHFDRFPPPGPRGRCLPDKPTLARTRCNEHDVPIKPSLLSRGFVFRWLSYAGPLTEAAAYAGPASETLTVRGR